MLTLMIINRPNVTNIQEWVDWIAERVGTSHLRHQFQVEEALVEDVHLRVAVGVVVRLQRTIYTK